MRRRTNAHRHGGRRPGTTTALVLLVLLVLVAAAGCSGALRASDKSSDTTTSATIATLDDAGAVGAVGAAETTAAAAALADGAASPPTNPPSTAVPDAAAGRMIIRTAELAVQVADVAAAAARVQSIVSAKGGFVAAQQGDYAGVPSLRIVLRVPAGSFDATLTGLRGLGRLTSLSTSSSEVTAQVVDLDSRLRTKRASADRLRTLLGSAAKAADLIEIERELSSREAEIESMQGQRNVLADQVALSTITVALSSTQPSDVRPPARQKPSFMHGLRGGGRAIVAASRSGAQAVGAVLPFLPVVLLLAIVLRLVRRRRRGTPASVPPPQSPTETSDPN